MVSRKLSLVSPAKVNLFLRVLRRRPDGFHDLASLFQAISLHDVLHVSLSGRDSLTCDAPSLPTDGSNLVLKAAALFRQKTGLQAYVDVHLEKRIPLEAGLGGGSSNAATLLWAFNELTDRPASLEELQSWAGQIGSDVPFFLSEGTAYCTGRGEHVLPLPALVPRKVTIVKPLEGLPTARVYGSLDIGRLSENNPQLSLEQWMRGQVACFNDLETPAIELLPSLRQLKQTLQESGSEAVLMSGSGTSFFCLGLPRPLQLPNVACFPACFVNRVRDAWYD